MRRRGVDEKLNIEYEGKQLTGIQRGAPHEDYKIPPALWATGGLKPSIFQPTPPSKDPFGEGFTPPLPLPGVPKGWCRSPSSTLVGPLGLFLATFFRIEFLMFFRSLF